ncbi:uncharacterized protein PADG_12492 [Paracoccidioides brasiliensis Pb18]|uniref:Uncharacterized protein n=1 Tax=Paracoccidioides brasiliensis (strain Pb18) TaxID=502780 RepID=A0A0A0HVG1_PARBD|nr:uncharacterized protein PADG_12492 [Paracoccidioides brasiliensis Pb18]KGM91420.1 hypothetical protein PADG_12492 [Paracoccidioides brasiliensis Pb18]
MQVIIIWARSQQQHKTRHINIEITLKNILINSDHISIHSLSSSQARLHLLTLIICCTCELNDMKSSSFSTSADSSKSRNVTSIHLNLHDLMTSNLLAAYEAEAQKFHAEALAAANMLDQIEEDLDVMKTKDLSRKLILEAAVKIKLKTELSESLTAVITAVQVILTSIVIISRSLQDMKTLLAQKNILAATLINAYREERTLNHLFDF